VLNHLIAVPLTRPARFASKATLTDEEHAAALNTFLLFFGDVMTTGSATAPVGRSSLPSVRTMTSDGRFAIGPDPDVRGLHWAAGLGGHGMLCAAVVGEIAAARLLDEESVVDAAAAACDPARLASGREARVLAPLPVPEVHAAPPAHGARTADRESSEDAQDLPA
jgi:hypothetical protein